MLTEIFLATFPPVPTNNIICELAAMVTLWANPQPEFWNAIRVPNALNNAGSLTLEFEPGLVILTVVAVLVLFTRTIGTRPVVPARTLAIVFGLSLVNVTDKGVTDNVAKPDVTVPAAFVTLTRYLLPFMAAVTFASVRVAVVAPAMFAQVVPALVDTCHWNVGAGVPVAVTLKDAACPTVVVRF